MKITPITGASVLAALAVVGLASLASAEPRAQLDAGDADLTPRMRELKQLRAQLARLTAEIARATQARKLEIERELQQLDEKLVKLLVQPPPKPGEGFEWLPISSNPVPVKAGETYAAVVQVGWLASIFVSASLIESKLREASQWFGLQVSAAPLRGTGVPWTTRQTGGRYWIIGAPTQARSVARPSQLLELFVRVSQG